MGRALLLAMLSLGLLAARADAQCQSQASGAILLGPDQGQQCVPGGPPPGTNVLMAGEPLNLGVKIQNTSTDVNNIPPNCGTDALLVGHTHIFLSCSDAGCPAGTQLAALTNVTCTPSVALAATGGICRRKISTR